MWAVIWLEKRQPVACQKIAGPFETEHEAYDFLIKLPPAEELNFKYVERLKDPFTRDIG